MKKRTKTIFQKNARNFVIPQIFVILFFFSSQLIADGYLLLDTGYRYDRINESLHFVTEPNEIPFFSDQNNFQNIQSYQLGAKGAWKVPCTCILVKGAAHYSWLLHGSYNENYFVKADLGGNYFIDASGGIGYPVCVCDCFNFTPFIGGSYDKANIRVTNSRTPFPGNPDHSGDKWYYSWYGPWIGFDFDFRALCYPITFNAGYEFHYGWAHQKNIPKMPRNFIYAYHVDYSHMIGNVFHMQCLYTSCSNWLCFSNWLYGINLQYSVWSNNHKVTAKPDVPFSETGLSAGMIQKQAIFTWHSFSATANLGFCF